MQKLLTVSVLALLIFLLSGVLITQAGPPSPFDPRGNGVPERIGALEVLAVVNDSNSTCRQPGTKELVLRTPETSLQNFLKGNPSRRINKAFAESNLNDYAIRGWTVVGPAISKSTVFATLEATT